VYEIIALIKKQWNLTE